MDTEFATDYLCQRFLKVLDPQAKGAIVEVGLGSLNYSFQWAAPLGYRCLAVEPLPTEGLILATSSRGVELIQAAMGATSGEVPIYHGELNGHKLPDISSLNPRWWGVSERCTVVPVMTLPDLCISKKIERISLLKVDTEGSEADILSLLPMLPRETLPRLLVVEYGGGGTLGSAAGGWSPEFFQGTQRLLDTAKELAYDSCIVLEKERMLPIFRRGPKAIDVSHLFKPNFQVGNLILIKDAQDAMQITKLIRSSALRLIQSECGTQIGNKSYYMRHMLKRLKCRLGLASR